MREPYTQIYVHLVWATWNRAPILTSELRPAIYACIRAECASLKAELIEIGGIANHVHILVRLPATISVAQLAKHVKGSSSHLATHRLAPANAFKRQGGYGAFTLARADVAQVQAYIRDQARHHRDAVLDADSERMGTEDLDG